MVWIVQQFAVVANRKRVMNGPIRKAADGAGNDECFTGRQNIPADGRIGNSSQGYGKQLIRTKRIVRCRCFSGLSGLGVETVGKIGAFFYIVMRNQCRLNF